MAPAGCRCVDEDFPTPLDRLQLQPNDMLIMVTDGITEARTWRQNFYGLARLWRTFQPSKGGSLVL
jgi:serine phosphatase RsbU (regulator of sigma subunit)